MGTAFTADSPLKVAHYGINTVVALADDVLLERLRKYYSELYNIYYSEINNNTKDYRADRITSYLNLVHDIVSKKYDEFVFTTKEKFEDIDNLKYFNNLRSELSKKFEIKILRNKFYTGNMINKHNHYFFVGKKL